MTVFIFQNAISCHSPILRDRTGNSLLFYPRDSVSIEEAVPRVFDYTDHELMVMIDDPSVSFIRKYSVTNPFIKCGISAL